MDQPEAKQLIEQTLAYATAEMARVNIRMAEGETGSRRNANGVIERGFTVQSAADRISDLTRLVNETNALAEAIRQGEKEAGR